MRSTRSAIARPVEYDEGLITSVVPYGEGDCIVRVFTKNLGFISAFFKRGLQGKKGMGAIFAPAMARVGIIHRSSMHRLVSCDIDPNFACSSSLKAFGYGAYCAEVLEKFLPENDPSPEFFLDIVDTFVALADPHPTILRGFELKLLDVCGYLPEIDLRHGADVKAFCPLSCQFLSDATELSVPFSSDALELAHAMLIAKIGSVSYEGMDELLMIGRIFQSRLRLLGLYPLKSVSFLRQVSSKEP